MLPNIKKLHACCYHVAFQPAVRDPEHPELRKRAGLPPFIRSRHGVTLTPEGEMLYRYVAPACERILRGEEELGLSLGLQVEQSASEQPKLLSTACCWIGWRCSRRSIRMSKSASVTEPLLTCFPI